MVDLDEITLEPGDYLCVIHQAYASKYYVVEHVDTARQYTAPLVYIKPLLRYNRITEADMTFISLDWAKKCKVEAWWK